MKTLPGKYVFKFKSGRRIIISKPRSCLLLILPENINTTAQNYIGRVMSGYGYDERWASREDRQLMEWLMNIHDNL